MTRASLVAQTDLGSNRSAPCHPEKSSAGDLELRLVTRLNDRLEMTNLVAPGMRKFLLDYTEDIFTAKLINNLFEAIRIITSSYPYRCIGC